MFQYGGGVKFQLTRRLVLRADFHGTLFAQPDLWTKSHPSMRDWRLDNGESLEPLPLVEHGLLHRLRISPGFGITI